VIPGWDHEKQVIQDAVTRTWQRVTRITFTDWGTYLSPPGGEYVRLTILEASGNQGGGSASKGQGASVTFNLRPTTPRDRIRYLAVHEFGHVLGFEHEDDSPERDPGCTSQQPWANVTPIGPWDRRSIMNSGCIDVPCAIRGTPNAPSAIPAFGEIALVINSPDSIQRPYGPGVPFAKVMV
jgi:hypothetical protein